MTRATVFSALFCLLVAAPGWTADAGTAPALFGETRANAWHVCFLPPCATAPAHSVESPATIALAHATNGLAAPQRRRPVVIEYSHGYQVRRKIHKAASFATLPLFGAALWLGQSLYSNTPGDHDARRTAHLFVGGSIVGLFAVNTVTGAWNLFGEGRKDPHGRRLRMWHGLLMMLADAGFATTVLTAPNSTRASEAFTYESDKVIHRNFAIASIGVATAGYLLMLLGNR